MSLAKKLSLIETVSVDYCAGARMGYVSYDHTEEVALKALDEAINLLEDYSCIFDLQLKLKEYNIPHKLHSKRVIEINNVQGNILDIITEVYDNYYSHSSVFCEGQISQMYIIDEGGGVCTIIVPQNK